MPIRSSDALQIRVDVLLFFQLIVFTNYLLVAKELHPLKMADIVEGYIAK